MDNLREKVINGLEHCKCQSGCNDNCPYFPIRDDNNLCIDECTSQLSGDALSLLKAQEPRVMTLEEVVSAECVWIEYAVSGNVVIAFPWNIELTDDIYNFLCNPNCIVEFRSLYGEDWRCWTSRPTEEQREAVKWE